MRNVTVSLDEETARWARIEAAKRDQSVSSFLRELLVQRMGATSTYEDAMKRYLARRPRRFEKERTSREELHDRAGLR